MGLLIALGMILLAVCFVLGLGTSEDNFRFKLNQELAMERLRNSSKAPSEPLPNVGPCTNCGSKGFLTNDANCLDIECSGCGASTAYYYQAGDDDVTEQLVSEWNRGLVFAAEKKKEPEAEKPTQEVTNEKS